MFLGEKCTPTVQNTNFRPLTQETCFWLKQSPRLQHQQHHQRQQHQHRHPALHNHSHHHILLIIIVVITSMVIIITNNTSRSWSLSTSPTASQWWCWCYGDCFSQKHVFCISRPWYETWRDDCRHRPFVKLIAHGLLFCRELNLSKLWTMLRSIQVIGFPLNHQKTGQSKTTRQNETGLERWSPAHDLLFLRNLNLPNMLKNAWSDSQGQPAGSSTTVQGRKNRAE